MRPILALCFLLPAMAQSNEYWLGFPLHSSKPAYSASVISNDRVFSIAGKPNSNIRTEDVYFGAPGRKGSFSELNGIRTVGSTIHYLGGYAHSFTNFNNSSFNDSFKAQLSIGFTHKRNCRLIQSLSSHLKYCPNPTTKFGLTFGVGINYYIEGYALGVEYINGLGVLGKVGVRSNEI